MSAHVAGTSGGFAAKIRFKGRRGVEDRYLEHPDCEKLVEASALLMALAIDPERVSARRQAPAQQPGSVEIAARPVAPPVTEPTEVATPAEPARDPPPLNLRPTSTQDRSFRVSVSALGFASGGVLPSVGPGAGLELAARRAHFQLGVLGRYWLPRVDPVPGAQDARIELSLVAVGLRVCGLPWLGELRLRACAGADVGDLAGSGQGSSLENLRTRHARFSAVSAGLAFSYGLQRVVPFMGLEGAWAIERPPFGLRVNGSGRETFRPSALNLSAFFGLSYAL